MAKSQYLFQFINSNLNGAGQVLFQENPVTGLLFIIGILWGTFNSSNPQIGIGAIIGLLVSTITASILKFDRNSIDKGLYGYNGILVGLSIPTFLINGTTMWLFLIAGAVLATIFTLVIEKLMKKLNLSPLTFPFVLVTWLLLLIANPSNRLASGFTENSLIDFMFYIDGTLKGFSQVFLINNDITGILFFIGLSLSSIRAAIWALIGSVTGLFIALLMEISTQNIATGLYGYSPVITAIALGSVYFKPSKKNTFYTFLGIILTTFLQIIMNITFTQINLPSLTAPFVFITWIFYYIYSLKKVKETV